VRREWTPEELIESWTLLDDAWRLVGNKTSVTRLGAAPAPTPTKPSNAAAPTADTTIRHIGRFMTGVPFLGELHGRRTIRVGWEGSQTAVALQFEARIAGLDAVT
jgi:hypothetical protein